MNRLLITGAVGVLLSLSAGTSLAHVTLERQEAHVGGSYKAVLRVPHGCKGSPTTSIRVRLPAGIIGVKPMPKPGWKLQVVTNKYPKPFTLRGAPVSEGVTELSWSGGNLPDAHYDEFVFVANIAQELPAGQTLYLPVVQECEQGVQRWIEIPSGKPGHGDGHGLADPAPALRLLPPR
jgi:uncharacterized protein YcnI